MIVRLPHAYFQENNNIFVDRQEKTQEDYRKGKNGYSSYIWILWPSQNNSRGQLCVVIASLMSFVPSSARFWNK